MTPQTSSRRVPQALIWLAVPVVVAGLAFAWWTISPLFINNRVDEAFPTSAPAAAAQPVMDEAMPTADAMIAEAMPTADTMMADSTSMADTMPTADAMMADSTSMADTMPTADAMAQPEPTMMPAEPVALASGSFTQIDALHGATGSATIYRLPEGGLVLRLEGFDAQNGPDLRVGLSGHPMPRNNTELNQDGYVELAVLKANQGNQNYELPADLDASAFKSVVIYCKAFSVVFSTAELAQ
jgi:hypothetical protein